jgi:hypothetical protein
MRQDHVTVLRCDLGDDGRTDRPIDEAAVPGCHDQYRDVRHQLRVARLERGAAVDDLHPHRFSAVQHHTGGGDRPGSGHFCMEQRRKRAVRADNVALKVHRDNCGALGIEVFDGARCSDGTVPCPH